MSLITNDFFYYTRVDILEKKGPLINDIFTGRSNHRSLHLLKLASAYQEGSPIVF